MACLDKLGIKSSIGWSSKLQIYFFLIFFQIFLKKFFTYYKNYKNRKNFFCYYFHLNVKK